MIELSTYLLLDGSCKEAMEFYHSCFGGELSISLVGDTPMQAMFPPEMHNRVINARLQAEGISLSASDWMLPSEQPFGLYGALNDKFGIRWMFHSDFNG
jgi:PhnB protein